MQRPGITLFDIDGPLRGGRITEWAEFLEKKGLFKTQYLEIVAGDLKQFKAGKISYRQLAKNILENFGKGMEGMSVLKVKKAAKQFVRNPELMAFHPHSHELVKRMNARGITVAITGQPQEFPEALREVLPFHMVFGSELEAANGKFTGKVNRNLALTKGQVVKELMRHPEYWKGVKYGFGDRVTDADMLRRVSKPIALNPDEKMRRYAKKKGWGIAQGNQILKRIRKR